MRPTYKMMALLTLTVPLSVLAGCASQNEMSALLSEVTTNQEMARSAQSQAVAVAAEASAAAAAASAAAVAAEQAAAAAQLAAEAAAEAAATAKDAAIKNELLELFHQDSTTTAESRLFRCFRPHCPRLQMFRGRVELVSY